MDSVAGDGAGATVRRQGAARDGIVPGKHPAEIRKSLHRGDASVAVVPAMLVDADGQVAEGPGADRLARLLREAR